MTPMPEDRFWSLIDASTAPESDSARAVRALRAALQVLSAEEIAAFQATFRATARKAYAWEVWGAAHVLRGGASDDAFEDFRGWLISRGRRVFEAVLANPDSLADLLPLAPGGVLDFEGFAYVAAEVWSRKAGAAGGTMPEAFDAMARAAEPEGEKFAEDEAHLAVRYPRLWQRFGRNPVR